jgi:hypothetical protein
MVEIICLFVITQLTKYLNFKLRERERNNRVKIKYVNLDSIGIL